MSAGLPSPDELVSVLETAGFEIVGRGRTNIRLLWPIPSPRHVRTVMVVTDETAPEYPLMVSALLAELDEVERRGQAAGAVLDLLRPTTAAERGRGGTP